MKQMRNFVVETKFLRGWRNPSTVWACGFRLFIIKNEKRDGTHRAALYVIPTKALTTRPGRASAHGRKNGVFLPVDFQSFVD